MFFFLIKEWTVAKGSPYYMEKIGLSYLTSHQTNRHHDDLQI